VSDEKQLAWAREKANQGAQKEATTRNEVAEQERHGNA
jgi:hypothetical protein